MGKLYALADLHIAYKFNRDEILKFFLALPSCNNVTAKTDEDEYWDSMVIDVPDPITSSTDGQSDGHQHSHRQQQQQQQQQHHPPLNFTEDGLILAGDLGEKLEQLRTCFELATKKFKTVWWVPGNHELYTMPGKPNVMTARDRYGDFAQDMDAVDEEDSMQDAQHNMTLRGEEKYAECCRIAKKYGVLTPEDEFIPWEYDVEPNQQSTPQLRAGSIMPAKETALVCPIFTLYDYSFRPADVSREQALDWAMEQGVQATDEVLLHPDPYINRDEWCWERVRKTKARLVAAQEHGMPLVIINHWPLREDLIKIPLVPRFVLWCGTKLTEDWHTRFNAKVVVTGHLHVRRTDWRDNCRFEEVSLGYPKQWEKARNLGRGIRELMREILPGPAEDVVDSDQPRRTIWRSEGI